LSSDIAHKCKSDTVERDTSNELNVSQKIESNICGYKLLYAFRGITIIAMQTSANA
jgi:hypothetical protein